jgi:anaphase-promoting complex subunit 7
MTRYETATAAPAQTLQLYNYEGNQFARLVREALCELELPYELTNCGKGSPRRAALRDIAPGAAVPFLVWTTRHRLPRHR